MKNLMLCFALLALLPANAWADVILGLSGNSMPGPINVTVSSTTGTDAIAAWEVTLQIVPLSGATGSLTFHTESATPPNPPNYALANGFGTTIVSNTGTQLQAYDFSLGGATALPPVGSSANLLTLTLVASPGASGSFVIVAIPGDPVGSGIPLTYFNNGSFADQGFGNIAGGGPAVAIGSPITIAAVAGIPEPSTFAIFGLSAAVLAGCFWRRKSSLQRAASTARG